MEFKTNLHSHKGALRPQFYRRKLTVPGEDVAHQGALLLVKHLLCARRVSKH